MQHALQRLDLLLHYKNGEVPAAQRLPQTIKDVFGAAYFLEAEPEATAAKSAGLVEPLQEAASQRRLAYTSQALDENPSRRTPHGAFQLKNGAVAANKTI